MYEEVRVERGSKTPTTQELACHPPGKTGLCDGERGSKPSTGIPVVCCTYKVGGGSFWIVVQPLVNTTSPNMNNQAMTQTQTKPKTQNR